MVTQAEEVALEIYDLIRTIRDPERPENLEELDVLREDYVTVVELGEDYYDITVNYKPTVEHCHLATLIGLFIREKIRREIPPDYFRYKLSILAIPGSLTNEEDANRQGPWFETRSCFFSFSHLWKINFWWDEKLFFSEW